MEDEENLQTARWHWPSTARPIVVRDGLRASDHSGANRRAWIGLGVLLMPCLLYSLDVTVLNLALPALSADLRPSATQLLWIVDIYTFVSASFLVPMGLIGDRIGRRRLLLIGAAAFGVASLLAAFSRSAGMLIAFRAVLGIAGATVAPATLSLIRSLFPNPRERTRAIGFWAFSYSAGAALGPVLGGLLLQHFWWGSAFLLGVPVMAVLLVLGPIFLPEHREADAPSLRLGSTLIILIVTLTAIYGLKRMAQHGLAWTPLIAIGLSGAAGWFLLTKQSRSVAPLFGRTLPDAPVVARALAIYAVGCFVSFGSAVLVAQYLQLVLGLRPLDAGLWTLPTPIMFILASLLTPRLRSKLEPAALMTVGLTLGAIGFGLLSLVNESSSPLMVALACSTYALGLTPVFIMATDLVVSSAPARRAGVASAVCETSAQLGGALGIAVLGSVAIAIYRSTLDPALTTLPATPPEVDTLAAALATASRLGGESGAMLLVSSRGAFVQGLHTVAEISAVLLALMALLSRRWLRANRSSAPNQSPS